MIGVAYAIALFAVSGWSHDYIWRGEARQIPPNLACSGPVAGHGFGPGGIKMGRLYGFSCSDRAILQSKH
ncbi:uncharacterized protein METZ01_LOCUS269499 [marine metagenome]|uniref:Uncharacterized protein n=1 Tax=marine metagenome TaxID=408172 RepID=A0A382JYA6_9ZZZZ